MKRQTTIEGSLFKIPLLENKFIYGRIVAGRTVIVYDSITSSELSFEEISKRKILFIIYVADYVFKKQVPTRWEIIGVYPLEEYLQRSPKFFVQNIADHSDLKIYDGNTDNDATFEECKNIERFSIWGHENVVERINDYYIGNTFGIAYRGRLKNIEEPTIIQMASQSLENDAVN